MSLSEVSTVAGEGQNLVRLRINTCLSLSMDQDLESERSYKNLMIQLHRRGKHVGRLNS